MADSKEIYRGFVREEAAAASARSRKRTLLQIHDDWRQAIGAGDAARFGQVVDVEGKRETAWG